MTGQEGNSRSSEKLFPGLAAGAAGALLALTLWSGALLDAWELRSWDMRARLRAQPSAVTGTIKLILVGGRTGRPASERPSSLSPDVKNRCRTAAEFCREAGARSVAFAMHPGSFSPQARPADDSGRVEKITVEGLDRWLVRSGRKKCTGSALTVPRSLEHSGMPLVKDIDGVVRRGHVLQCANGAPHTSPGIGAVAEAAADVRASIDGSTLHIGGFIVPLALDGTCLIRFRGPADVYETFSLDDIVRSAACLREGRQATVDPAVFAGAHVFIGDGDVCPTPLGAYPRAGIAAAMLDCFLAGGFLHAAEPWRFVLACMLLALTCGVVLQYCKPLPAALVAAVYCALPWYAAQRCYVNGLWLHFAALEAGVLFTALCSLTLYQLTEGRRRRALKKVFRGRLATDRLKQVMDSADERMLAWRSRRISVLSCCFEDCAVPDSLLQDYADVLGRLIMKGGGTLAPGAGRALCAFWNAPLEEQDHAGRAVLVALNCRRAMWELRTAFREKTGCELVLRTGLATAPGDAGIDSDAPDAGYTVRGPALNHARQAQQANGLFGTHILVTEATARLLESDVALREIVRVVFDDTAVVKLYEPMYPREYERKCAVYESFENGVRLFYQGDFSGAHAVFSRIAERDPVARVYAKKASEWAHRPPPHWRGYLQLSD